MLLLLFIQLPEEQAFAVLVKVMSDYGLRDMFKNDFEMLHTRFFQLERLLEVRVMGLPAPWR